MRFSSTGYAVGEDGGNATITVTRSGDLSGTSTVNLSTGTGSATADADYSPQSNTVVSFAAGQASATAQIPIANDGSVEDNETVPLTLSAPSAGTSLGGPNAATLTIYDEDSATAADPAPTVAFTSPAEGAAVTTRRATALGFDVSADTTRVQVLVGGREICNDTAAPFTCDFTPTTRDVGNPTLVAVATDASGQKAIDTRTVQINRLAPSSLSLRVSPSRDRSSPYTFTASGKLGRKNAQSISAECRGTVVVTFKVGRTTFSKSASVKRDCTWSVRGRDPLARSACR